MFDRQDQDVVDKLNLLAEPAEARPSPHQALARFKQSNIHQRRTTMNRKFAVGLAAAVLLAVFAFSFSGTRALASSFLGLFRVQKFAPISVSPQQLQFLSELAEDGIYPGEVTFLNEPAAERYYDSLAQASDTLPNRFATLTAPQLGTPQEIAVQPGAAAQMTINLEGSRQLLEAVGVDPAMLPDSLEGETITFEANDILRQTWQDVTLIQMQAPSVRYPDGVDPALVGQALLQVLGMSESEAARVAANIDWTSTLIMPIPQQFATFREVPISDTSGLAIESLDDEGVVLLWQQYGIVYMIAGDGYDVDGLAQIANTLSPAYR